MSNVIDAPIKDISLDKFSRAKFAEKIASLVVRGADDKKIGTEGVATGAIVGLNGAWGSGKTSILNFIAKFCEKHDPIVVIKLNPWIISGETDPVKLFFSLLGGEIDRRVVNLGSQAKDLKKVFARYAEAGGWLAAAATGLPGLGQLAKSLVSDNPVDLNKARDDLIFKLSEYKIPIVVLIDEIDRLEDNEIKNVMKLVKSVLDLPSISCVLAYDFERVVDALGTGLDSETKYARGVKYLEKIVTVNIQVPLLYEKERKQRIVDLLEDRRQALNFAGNFEKNAPLENLLEILLEDLIKTPRDINRLIAMFDFLLSSTDENKNWIDYLAYAALSVKCPHILNQIFDHPQELTYGETKTIDKVFDAKRLAYCDIETANRYKYTFDNTGEANLFAFIFDRYSFNQINNDKKADRLNKAKNLAQIMRVGM